MDEKCSNLPNECWTLIFNRVDPRFDWESLSLVCKRFLSITNLLRVHLHIPNPSICILSKLLQRFPLVKKIKLANFPGDRNLNKALCTIAQSGLDLEELDISGNDSRINVCLEACGSNMKNLKVLNCTDSSLTDADLVRIADSFRGLQELQIRNRFDFRMVSLTDEGIQFLSTKFERLRKISVRLNRSISDKGLILLSSNCAYLEEIELIHCSGVTGKGISFILENTRHLNSLVVNIESKLEPFGIRGSGNFPENLLSLCIEFGDISDNFLHSIIGACIHLRELSLIRCKGHTFSGISSLLQSCRSLKSLVLMGDKFLTNENMELVSRFLPNLVSIKLHCCLELSDSALVALIQRCPLLGHLEIVESSLGGEDYNYDDVEGNYSVTSLSLSTNKYLSRYVVRRLLNIFPCMEKLCLAACFQREESLDIADVLGHCNWIKSLDLTFCRYLKFSDKDAQVSKLEKLDAAYSWLDDQMLGVIGKCCPNLLELYLNGCKKLTEEGVKEVVRSCKRLRYLNIEECSNMNYDITAWIVSNRPSLWQLIIPAELYPKEEHQNFFLQDGCVVYMGWRPRHYNHV